MIKPKPAFTGPLSLTIKRVENGWIAQNGAVTAGTSRYIYAPEKTWVFTNAADISKFVKKQYG